MVERGLQGGGRLLQQRMLARDIDYPKREKCMVYVGRGKEKKGRIYKKLVFLLVIKNTRGQSELSRTFITIS